MDLDRVKLAYFSPTGTTRAIARAIARGLDAPALESIDATCPQTRERPLTTREGELLVAALPVYMGRVPALSRAWLHGIEGRGAPAVCVVVYGNRAYDDALLELRDILTERGLFPIACAAYIGEHSFSTPGAPTARGRPDRDDLDHAEAFGRKVREKLESLSSLSGVPEVRVPGVRPYGGVTVLWDVDFIAVGDQCLQCGLCARICPAGAIDPRDASRIDRVKCVTCCACLKNCPQRARTMKPGPVRDASLRLNTLYNEPKRPECFL